jgi:hypothetical protein
MSASCLENVTLFARKKQLTVAHNEQFSNPINNILCLLWTCKLCSYAHPFSATFFLNLRD